MDIINLVIGFLKDFGQTVWRGFDYQIYHSNYVNDFQNTQKQLKDQQVVVEANLQTQLMRGKIRNPVVETWLKDASEGSAEEVIEDLMCKGGCFTYICSSRKLHKRTQALRAGILQQGERYSNPAEILVIDDHSIQYCASEFEAKQREVKHEKEKIEANLATQLKPTGKIAWNKVTEWLDKASQLVTMKVEDQISQGQCSSSTNIEEKIEELKRTLEEGKEYTNVGVSLVIDDHSKKGVPMSAEKCIARAEVQGEILQLLRGDKVTRIAVCGMGGVGKTTIMKQVHNQLLNEPTIKKVIWVKVSKDCDIVQLKKSIAGKLELDLKEDEDAGRILQKLQQGRCVLILDDVWEPFSLEAVGILDPDGNDACKLVLTTRSQQGVARKMMCKEINVKPLSDGDALALFLDKVEGELVHRSGYRSEIEPFLNQILKKCNGLPLAIVVVARAMRGKFNRYSWKTAVKQLSRYKEIDERLKFSYDYLEEQCQKCFLYCALYPEDHEISEEELIEFWIEEGFIIDEGGSRDSMICEGRDILEKLIDNCMLELVKNRDYSGGWSNAYYMVNITYEEDRVSMHDLLRDMALKIIGPRSMVKAGMALEELPKVHKWREDLLTVSLMNNNIREIPSSMLSPKCPMLTTFLLSSNKITTIPEAFFDQMLGLKILDLSRNYELVRLPSSVSKLENLTTLLLENCWSLKEVPSLSNLGGLKKLNFYRTSIEELPQGLDVLTNLEYLWLGDKLSEIPNGLLGSLSKLQYLGVGFDTPLKWEQIERLRKLESLVGCLSTLDDMSLFMKSRRESGREFSDRYRIVVGTYKLANFCSNKTFRSAKKLIVCRHIDICKEPGWLPSDVQGFYILDCNDVRSLNDISGLQEAIQLQHCTIQNCDSLELVVSSRCLKLLQNLKSLYLYHLKNLNAVVGEIEAVAKSALLPVGTFSSLQRINVDGCRKMKKLLPLWLLRYLQNLQTINVFYCDQMEEIIWSEYEGEKTPEKLTLPKLQSLYLMNLPVLKSIYSGSSTVLICDSIKEIKINDCREIESVFWRGFNPLPTLESLQLYKVENLKIMFDEEALGLSAPPTSIFALERIIVHYCHKLKKVFSSERLLECFQSLETIAVGNCDQLEELISSSTYEEIEVQEKITIPNLQRLALEWLPELNSICSNSNVLICDSIERVKIVGCKKLKRIPLHLSSSDNGQPLSFKRSPVWPKESGESLEWDRSHAKDVLLPSVN